MKKEESRSLYGSLLYASVFLLKPRIHVEQKNRYRLISIVLGNAVERIIGHMELFNKFKNKKGK